MHALTGKDWKLNNMFMGLEACEIVEHFCSNRRRLLEWGMLGVMAQQCGGEVTV